MKELTVDYKFDLKSNMNLVRSDIEKHITQYDVVIQESDLKDAKSLMATFNKDKKEFTDRCKSFLSEITEPINQFKIQQKEIEKLFDNGREKIKSQVEKFEATKLLEIENVLKEFCENACNEACISIDTIQYKDLVKLTAVTSTMKIAKVSVDAITSRIQFVQNEILKAKVEAQEKAARDAEIAEQAKIKAEQESREREDRLRKQFEEKSKQDAINAENKKQLAVQKAIEEQKQKEVKFEEVENVEAGKKIINLIARFQIKVPAHISEDKVIKKLDKMLRDAGITEESLVGIEAYNA